MCYEQFSQKSNMAANAMFGFFKNCISETADYRNLVSVVILTFYTLAMHCLVSG